MKRKILKCIAFVLTFIVALIAAERIMNKGHENMTMEMAEASFPLVSIERGNLCFNELHGYKNDMDPAFQREIITVLEEDRKLGFRIETFGCRIENITVEVRNIDGSRLIEKTEITDFTESEQVIREKIQLKDLIEKDTEYLLIFLLDTGEGEIKYYSRMLWSDDVYFDEKVAFIQDFHERTFDKEAARELTKYLEPNSQLEDNKSFHKVNIHSSFRQITWGSLNVLEETEPVIELKEITSNTASFLMKFMVSTTDVNKNKAYYQVEEYYRIRYSEEVQYLLDYERTMTQLPDVNVMYANDKILLGITEQDIPMKESEDGNVVAFTDAGQLFSYNVTENSLAVIFSFFDSENMDNRTTYGGHTIKILDVTEGGDVNFAVYGYMNRGRHEGEVGIQIYSYSNILNTMEEIVYIPCRKSAAFLQAEMENLLYLNREQKLYIMLENNVYAIDLKEREYEVMAAMEQDEPIQVSEDNRIMVTLVLDKENDINHCGSIKISNLSNEEEKIVSVSPTEAIRPLGFMGEDIIYGVARKEEITEEKTGRVFFPMYKLCISDSGGNLLKEYEQNNVYITGCDVEGNQITIQRIRMLDGGGFTTMEDDHITNNTEVVQGKNQVVAADIDIYERYVQIQTRNSIDVKTIKILTPKEVVFEGGRNLHIEENEIQRFFVYGPYGINGIYNSAASAVNLAYSMAGTVADETGKTIWMKGTRLSRNQIMSIREEESTESGGSLSTCLNVMLKYEGIVASTEYLLTRGQSVMEILESNLQNYKILDLTGCSLDAVLYYVNQDIPVLALLKSGDAVLLTGFNDSEVVVMDPATGTLEKRPLSEVEKWLEENNNSFITYLKPDGE